ncbi:MAG: metal-dependent transcriptional regulator [Planctomycetota bacterium]|jgi:DtxR family Mn-dependent transcriptional regulator
MMMASVYFGFILASAALVVGIMYLGSPTDWLGWWRRLRQTRRRVLGEDALKYIHNCGLRGEPATSNSLAQALGQRARATETLIGRLQSRGWIRSSPEGLTLTPEGVRLALQVIRAHRLWECYLADEARMPLSRVHAEAEWREHAHSPEELDALEAAMGHPTIDPHGDPIPTREGELAELSARAVVDWPLDTPARIVHLEDEPPAIFAQIAAQGLSPGQIIRVLQADAEQLVLSDSEQTHVLSPTVGANIFVTAVDADAERVSHRRLTSLKPGQRATVGGLAEALQGFTRRRLLDFGLTPGVAIEAEMSGIFRDPVAYRVRGSLVALRGDQAEHVLIRDTTASTNATTFRDATVRERRELHHG